MWPWSIIRRLEARVAGLQGDLARADANYSTGVAVGRELRNKLIASQEAVAQKDGDIRHLNGRIVGAQSINNALAAERDEAVLRARSVEESLRKVVSNHSKTYAELKVTKQYLRGAMVRNAKGQLVKWVDESDDGGRRWFPLSSLPVELETVFQPDGEPERLRVTVRGGQAAGKSLLIRAIVDSLLRTPNVRWQTFHEVNGGRRVPFYVEQSL